MCYFSVNVNLVSHVNPSLNVCGIAHLLPTLVTLLILLIFSFSNVRCEVLRVTMGGKVWFLSHLPREGQLNYASVSGNSRRHTGIGSRGPLQKPLRVAFHSQNCLSRQNDVWKCTDSFFWAPYRPNIGTSVTLIKSKRRVISHFSACWASHRYKNGCGVRACVRVCAHWRKWAHLRFLQRLR